MNVKQINVYGKEQGGKIWEKIEASENGWEVKLKGISSNHVADEQNILFNNALKAINRG